MAVENENTIMGVIESEIGGSPICEAVKQIAGTLFETSLNDAPRTYTTPDDCPSVSKPDRKRKPDKPNRKCKPDGRLQSQPDDFDFFDDLEQEVGEF